MDILALLQDNIGKILTGVISIGAVSIIFGKALSILKEISELLTAVVMALSDKEITSEEIKKIVKEAKDIPVAIKSAMAK